MHDRWKDEVAKVPDVVLEPLHKIACEQTDCIGRGFEESDCGKCATCADIADSVVGEFLYQMRVNGQLTNKKAPEGTGA